MGVFSNAKDRLVEGMALSYLNGSLLGPYGKANSLKLDSSARTVRLELDLKGESSPVQIEIIDYQLTQDGSRYYASAREVRTSREWLTALANDRIRDQKFEIPAQTGALIQRFLD